jgi:hypothetical protein
MCAYREMAILQKGATTTNTTTSGSIQSSSNNNMQQLSAKEQLPSEYWMSYIEVSAYYYHLLQAFNGLLVNRNRARSMCAAWALPLPAQLQRGKC